MKDSKITLTAIVPVFNEELFLKESLKRLLKISVIDEVIVVDDCSTDNSFELVKGYSKRDQRVKCFKNKANIGCTKTLNRLIEKTRGQYIARMDADDISFEDRIEKQYRLLIKQDYDVSIPELIGDVDQLIQAVLNIVKNAVRVMDGQGQIVLRTRVARNFTIGNDRHRLVAQIEIGDSGPGIPPEISETLFLPMVTSGDGQGLGLSIAQSLITQHKGLVECRSRPGDTVFTILLPLAGEQPTLRGTPT